MDKRYCLTSDELGRQWLTCDGVTTSISIAHFFGYTDDTECDDYIVYCRGFFGAMFRVGSSTTLDGAFNIAINYWECRTGVTHENVHIFHNNKHKLFIPRHARKRARVADGQRSRMVARR